MLDYAPYRSAIIPVLDVSRDLWRLRNAYEGRYRRGVQVLSIFCAGLIPLRDPTRWAVILFCVVPCLLALPFMILGAAERFAPLPSDVLARARHSGVRRKLFEHRYRWVDRLMLVEGGIA